MRPSPLLDAPGALAADSVAVPGGAPAGPGAADTVPAADPDALVPAHYGDPLREQRLLADGLAVSALARDIVAVTGADRLTWLTTLSSQRLTGLAPGDGGAEALLLDARGHIAHALAALDDGRTLLLVTEAGDGPALADLLDRMRFMLRVEVRPREDLVALGALGAGRERLRRAADAVGALVGAWTDPWPGVVEGGTSYDVGLDSPHPGRAYAAGFVLVPATGVVEVVRVFAAGGLANEEPPAGVPADESAEDAADGPPAENAAGGSADENAAGGPAAEPGGALAGAAEHDALAGAMAWEALRIEAGRPRRAREVDERAIPHELDWLRTAVHLAKGCYPGQETVARTLNLGRPPRRLTLLQLDGLAGGLPAPGDAVRLGERTVGAVTSVARHHELGPIALALLRRGVPAGAALSVDVSGAADGAAGASAETAGAAGGPGAAPGERVVVGRVAAAQEPLVTPEGRAQASPAERPGAGLRTSLLHRRDDGR
ncbi:aminomethyltransferase [Actinomyces sp. oral taxon 414]|uniref:CAF17-like 4Fe-4S cluster assembly/insertion protein YgfZ n=1 Tax=Actinomyces sp. oral taxon 414 TaxID=712122 RepID=UPI0006BC0F13|nr:folate-binding protein YgfZ [Actinomyces sp. oral taxon 414]ALC99983.1 aminomethyltransferase [Actinomyces sp. oral taxon 414]